VNSAMPMLKIKDAEKVIDAAIMSVFQKILAVKRTNLASKLFALQWL